MPKRTGPSAQFFEQLLDIVSEYGGEHLIKKFDEIKSFQEHYLQMHWEKTPERGADTTLYREVDYLYLLSLLRNDLSSQPETVYDSHLQIVELCIKFGEYQKAQQLVAFLSDFIDKNQREKHAELLMQHAKLAFLMNDWKRSERYSSQALDVYDQLDDPTGKLKTLNNIGIIAYERWQTEKGKSYFLRARDVVEKYRDSIANSVQYAIQIETNLGVIEDIQGNSEEAVEIFNDLYETIPDAHEFTKLNILISKSTALRNLQKFEEAETHLLEALNMARNQSNQRMIGLSHLNLADVYVRLGQYARTYVDIEEAFSIFSKLHDQVSLADTYRVFGMLYREQGYHDLAESQFQISILLNREYNNLLTLSETYYERSVLAKTQNTPTLWKEYLQKAMDYAKAMDAEKRYQRLQAELDRID